MRSHNSRSSLSQMSKVVLLKVSTWQQSSQISFLMFLSDLWDPLSPSDEHLRKALTLLEGDPTESIAQVIFYDQSSSQVSICQISMVSVSGSVSWMDALNTWRLNLDQCTSIMPILHSGLAFPSRQLSGTWMLWIKLRILSLKTTKLFLLSSLGCWFAHCISSCYELQVSWLRV